MALVRYGEGQQRSGSLGATVYSHNRYGQYMRARSTPVNPQSARQQAVRQAIRSLTTGWSQVLTGGQRANWNGYAEFVPWKNHLGDEIYLTGLSWYVRGNVPRVIAGLPRADDGPDTLGLPDGPSVLTGAMSAATQVISVTFNTADPWVDEDDAALLVSQGIALPTTRDYYGGPWRYADKVDGDSTTPPTSPAAMAAAFSVAEGQKCFLSARVSRADGRLSVATACSFLCAA